MSDSIAPQTNPAAQPETHVGAAHPDIDIEALLDQAQALVEDAAGELNADSNSHDLSVEQPAADDSPAPAEAAAAEQLASAPPMEAPLPQQEPEVVVAVAPVAPTAPEEPPLAPELPTPVAEADVQPVNAEAAPTVEDFGIASAAPQDPAVPPAPELPKLPAAEPQSSPSRRSGARSASVRFGEAALRLFDLPFARLSDESRQRLGWAAIATFVMALAAWLLPLVHPRAH